MKILAVVVLATLSMFGCKKHTNNPPYIPVGFSAKINNVLWTPPNYAAKSFYWTTPNGDSQLALGIHANDGPNGHELYLGTNWYFPTTSYYSIDDMNSFAYYYYDTFKLAYYDGYTGTIRITKISSNNIQGTFNVIIYNPDHIFDPYNLPDSSDFKITDGQFNVPLN